MKAVEAQALPGQAVDVWHRNRPARSARLAEPEVVDQDDHDLGRAFRRVHVESRGRHGFSCIALHDGGRCGSNFEYAAPLAETVQLGLAAIRAGVPLEWDAAAGRVTNHAFANQFIGPGYDYRPGWGV